MSDLGPLVLFGGGRMGSAMLHGWINGGVPAEAITVVEPTPSDELATYCAAHGIALNTPPRAVPGQTIILAVKPQKVAELGDTIAGLAAPRLMLVSIMAGKTTAGLRVLFPAASAVVRAMPNLPAAVGRGATVGFADAGCDDAQRALAERLLSSTGAFGWLDDEDLIDAATGVSGSGPAYLFYLADCLTEAGIAAGLPHALAEQLARATVAGAGEMLHLDAKSAAELRRDVTSPAGTTEAGLKVLMADGTLQKLMTDTVAATTARARELAA